MPLTLINLTGFIRGVVSDEVGVNIREVRRTIEPEFIEVLGDKQNLARGKAVAPMKLTASISGEISGATGIMAATAATAFTPANSMAFFGAPTTGLYLTRAEVSNERASWHDLSADFEAYAGIP